MNSDSDLQIAGDILEVLRLLRPQPEHPSTVADFVGLARTVAAVRARWAQLVRFDATTRWYRRLLTGPGYEVWLLSWVPGQGTGGPHDHGPSSGVLTVLDGALTEHTVAAGRSGPARRVLRPGDQRVLAPGHVHEIVNDSLEPAVSLHVYFPGLTEMPMRPPHALTCAPTHRDVSSPRVSPLG